MKKSLLLCAALGLALSLNAETVTWVAATALADREAGTTADNMVKTIDFGDVTLTLDGNGAKDAKCPNIAALRNDKTANEGKYERVLRVYFTNTLRFKGNTEDIKITKIEFTNSEDSLDPNDATYSSLPMMPFDGEFGTKLEGGGGEITYGSPTSVWNGDSNFVDITPNAGASKQVRFAAFTVTYTNGAGVHDIVMDENAPVEYFNMQGVQVAEPVEGIFIKRQGSKVSKVIVK